MLNQSPSTLSVLFCLFMLQSWWLLCVQHLCIAHVFHCSIFKSFVWISYYLQFSFWFLNLFISVSFLLIANITFAFNILPLFVLLHLLCFEFYYFLPSPHTELSLFFFFKISGCLKFFFKSFGKLWYIYFISIKIFF